MALGDFYNLDNSAITIHTYITTVDNATDFVNRMASGLAGVTTSGGSNISKADVIGNARFYSEISDYVLSIVKCPVIIPTSNFTTTSSYTPYIQVGLYSYYTSSKRCWELLPTTTQEAIEDIIEIANFTIEPIDDATFVQLMYSEVSLYLPWFGFIKVDQYIIYKYKLRIEYNVDITTNTIAVRVYVFSKTNEKVGMIYENNTDFGYRVPFGSTSFEYSKAVLSANNDVIKSQMRTANTIAGIGSVGKIIGGLATGNGSLTYSGVKSGVMALQNAYTKNLSYERNNLISTVSGGTSSLTTTALSMTPLTPFLQILTPEYYIPVNYGQTYGYNVGQTMLIGDMEGYTVCSNFHIDFAETKTETDMIFEKLHLGFFINKNVPTPKPPSVEPEPEPTPELPSTLSCFKGTQKITATIGATYSPYSETNPHKGLDLVGVTETTVYSLGDNWKVVKVGWESTDPNVGFGYYVKLQNIDTDSKWYGYYLFYGHLQANSSSLKVGQVVNRGDTIGIMGSTGFVTGAHTHVEMRNPQGDKIVSNYLLEYTGLPNKTGTYTYDFDTGEWS